MVDRLCIIFYFLSELAVPWCVEQPQSSLLELAPSFQWLSARFDVWKAVIRLSFLCESMTFALDWQSFVWLGSYGGTSKLLRFQGACI